MYMNVCNALQYIWHHRAIMWDDHVASITLHYIIFVILTFFGVLTLFTQGINLSSPFLVFWSHYTANLVFEHSFDFELHFICLVTMTVVPKRKYTSKNNQEQLLQAFYDNLRNDEDSLFGHRFVDNDDSYVESETNLEEESERERTNAALEPIMDDAAGADSEASWW